MTPASAGKRATGRIHLSMIVGDAGEYLNNQTSRLYRHLRENSGTQYAGAELDGWGLEPDHICRNTSTRKSEINLQVDPRVEWIDHWEGLINEADPKSAKVHWYRHRFTQGRPPADSGARCAEILEGQGEPVRGAGQPTRYAPGQPAPKRHARATEAQPARAPAMATAFDVEMQREELRTRIAEAHAQAAPALTTIYDAQSDGRLFDGRPWR